MPNPLKQNTRSVLVVLPDPSSSNVHQRILANAKSNLSDAKPLTYRTARTTGVITVEWLEESDHPLSELMDVAANKYEHSQLDEACFVLYSTLVEHGGPMPATDVKRKANEALVSERTLKRAKGKLGVRSRRHQVWDDEKDAEVVRWVWQLPEDGDVLQPYKERAVREHVNAFLDSCETEDMPSASKVENEAEPVVDEVPQPITPSIHGDVAPQDASDWMPSDRPWDDC